jgi:hypothetical protein
MLVTMIPIRESGIVMAMGVMTFAASNTGTVSRDPSIKVTDTSEKSTEQLVHLTAPQAGCQRRLVVLHVVG